MSDTIQNLTDPVDRLDIFRLIASGLGMSGHTTMNGYFTLDRDPYEVGEGRTFLRLYEGDDHFARVARADVPDADLRTMLAAIPESVTHVRDTLCRSLGITLTTNDMRNGAARRQRVAEEEERRNRLVERIMALPKPVYADAATLPLHPKTSLGVFQAEGAITDRASRYPQLGTTGIGPCIAVILRNPALKRVALVHVEKRTDMRELGKFISRMRDNDSDPIEVTLWGGRPEDSEAALEQAVNFLEAQKGVRIVAADVLSTARSYSGSDSRVSAIAVDDTHIRVGLTNDMQFMLAPHEDACWFHSQEARSPDVPAHLGYIKLAYDREVSKLPGFEGGKGGANKGWVKK